MATTVQTIITGGLGRSFHSRPDALASSAGELLPLVTKELQGLFAVGARIDPEYYSRRVAVGFVGTGWIKPTGFESFWQILNSDGEKVYVVPATDLRAATGNPAVTYLSGVYLPTGLVDGPASGTLDFYGSRLPDALAALTDTLDSAWPEQFNSLLELRIASYLAKKDRRGDDVSTFEGEWDGWFGRYATHLEHSRANVVRRSGIPRTMPTPALAVLKQVVTGGAPATP